MILIDSDYEGGAIAVVAAEQADDIQLALTSDRNAHFHQWFYFSVETPVHTEQRLRIINADQAAFPDAWRDYRVLCSHDGEHWFRADTDYNKGELQIRLVAQSEKTYYAYFVPYSNARLSRLVGDLHRANAGTVESLGLTAEGRSVDLIRMGSRDSGARKLWLIARQHPGETMSQWLMEGFVRELMAQGTSAELPGIFIVPNMNPDGAAQGQHRFNAAGTDLNRQWRAPDPQKASEVDCVRAAMLYYGVDAFVDVHGDETIAHNFMMNACGDRVGKQLKLALAAIDGNFQLVHDYSTNGKGCGAACATVCGQKQTATDFVRERFNVSSLLLEMSFKPLQTPGAHAEWTHLDCLALGRNLVRAMRQIGMLDAQQGMH